VLAATGIFVAGSVFKPQADDLLRRLQKKFRAGAFPPIAVGLAGVWTGCAASKCSHLWTRSIERLPDRPWPTRSFDYKLAALGSASFFE